MRIGIIAAFLSTKISRACRVRYTTTWHIVITFVRNFLWRNLIRHARPPSDTRKMKHFCHKIRHTYGKPYLVSSVWSRSEDALILCSDGGGRTIYAGIYTQGCPVFKNIKTFFESSPKSLNEKIICENFRIDPVTQIELSLSILVFSLFIAILTITYYRIEQSKFAIKQNLRKLYCLYIVFWHTFSYFSLFTCYEYIDFNIDILISQNHLNFISQNQKSISSWNVITFNINEY